MPLLDADIAALPASEGKGRRPLIITLAIALAIAGVTIGIFVFVPEQATETVREVVQAAKSLLKIDNPPANPTQEEDFAKPEISSHRKPRGHGSAPADPKAPTVRAEPSAARPGDSLPRLLHKVNLPPGTTRLKVRELLGEPDLVVSKVEHNHVVEHFVYVNNSLHSATSVLLIDGRVSSVQAGTPTVGLSKTPTKPTPAKTD